jgi:DNA-binding transcriptional LysR family regulator
LNKTYLDAGNANPILPASAGLGAIGGPGRRCSIPLSIGDGYHDEVPKYESDLVPMLTDKKRRFSRHAMPTFNLQLRQVQAFVALVEKGSVTAASRALGLAQSTVSEAITALERELGTALIAHKRGTHTVALTPAGKVLLPRAREVLAAVEKTYAAVAETAVSARGVVNIIANESVSTYVLSQVLMTIRRRWRNTQFAVSVAACPEVREGVRGGAFDLGLLLTSAKRKSLARSSSTNAKWSQGEQVIAPLVPLVMFAAPNHPLVRPDSRAPVRRSALDLFPVFVSDAIGEYRALLERFFREDDLPGPRLESTGSIEGVKAGVFTDARALGILPSYAVAKEVQTGRVVPLDLRPVLPPMQIVALLGLRAIHPSTEELLEEMGRIYPTPAPSRVIRPERRSGR